MKKLNKKGFTLVELLAVIVILALLIVVVATTALPAMQNAKTKALKTYTERVMEQAKGLYISSDGDTCSSTTPCDELSDIMGSDVTDDYEITTDFVVSGNMSTGYTLSGAITDKDGNVATIASDGKTVDITPAS